MNIGEYQRTIEVELEADETVGDDIVRGSAIQKFDAPLLVASRSAPHASPTR